MNGAERFRIGDYDCWTLADGELTYPGWTVLPPEGRPPAELTAPYIGLLVDTGSTRILIDTGAGALGPTREAAGKSGCDGLLTGRYPCGGPFPRASGPYRRGAAFPNAAVVMMRKEYDFWMCAGDSDPAGGLRDLRPRAVGGCDAASVGSRGAERDRLRLLDRPAEIAAGVLVFPAPGHTPGHAAVLVSSGRQQLLYVGDALVHPAQFEHPEWVSAFDLSPRKRCARGSSCWSGRWLTGVFSRAIHLPGGLGPVEARQERFVGNRLLPPR